MSIEVPASRCLNCNKEADGVTGLNDNDRPSPGDYTVCVYCGHIMVFTDDLTNRAMTDAEMIEIAGNEDLLKVQQIIQSYKQSKKEPHEGE